MTEEKERYPETDRETLKVRETVPILALPVKAGESSDVKELCKMFRIVRTDITRMTGYSLRSVDKWAAGGKIGVAPNRRLNELRRLLDALGEIMEPAGVGEWLKAPNDAFEGSTPLQVIECGEADRIWRMVYLVETGEPV